MKLVFFGTPEYVLPVIESLHKTFRTKEGSPIVAVVTQKPRKAGRKQNLKYSAIDKWAHQKEIPVFYDSSDLIKENVKADVGILAAYGAIIPKLVIEHLKFGILNIHPSLLPKFRGASPVQATLITGEQAGATIIKLDEKLDHGPILTQFKEVVKNEDTTESLRKRLFDLSANLIVELLPAYLKGKIKPKPQDHTQATYTTLVKKADGFIPPKYLKATFKGLTLKGRWEIPFIKDYSLKTTPQSLDRFIRAMQPWPIAWTNIKIKRDKDTRILRLKILKAAVVRSPKAVSLALERVQLEGKNPVSWRQFTEAYPNFEFL